MQKQELERRSLFRGPPGYEPRTPWSAPAGLAAAVLIVAVSILGAVLVLGTQAILGTPDAGGATWRQDLGALATEFLVLGVNPHPRKPGAEFGSLKVGDDSPHHFAALEALKKRLGGGKS